LFDLTVLRDHLLEPWFIEGMIPIKKPNDRKKYAKECCLSSSPEDDNCPFILYNLSFAQFSNFLATRTSRTGKHQGQVLKLLNASYEQSQSALKHLFWMSKYEMHSSFTEQLKQFTMGIRRTATDKKKVERTAILLARRKWITTSINKCASSS
jgi:hypothetical protein